MWKRISSAIAAVVKPSVASGLPPQPQASTVFGRAHPNAQAHKELQEAVRELSQGTAKPVSMPTAGLLQSWTSKETKDLKDDELELLARAYFEGTETFPKNPAKAAEIWTTLSKNNNVEAKYSLSMCLREGVGVEKDQKAAFELMSNLAEIHNYPLGHFSMALMLSNGEGVAQDYDRAYKHFRLAGKAGILPALHNIANCYSSGRGVKQSDRNALLFYEAAADAGDPSAKFTLATWLFQGRHVIPDKERAFKLQVEAAEMGHPGAMFNAGSHLFAGHGVEVDLRKAAEYFDKASTIGNFPQATINLGNMYRQGLGVEQNLELAAQIYERHANRDPNCKILLDDTRAELRKLKK